MADRFELLERIGRGGMGTVWKARDRSTGQIVALKLLHGIFADDKQYLARFEREVEVSRRIDSPYVVQVLGYGRQGGNPYIAMEFVDGRSLRDVLRTRKKLRWDEAQPIAAQVAEGLKSAHAVNVIHRDVKPSNILIAADGTAKLADFGIARAMDLTRLTGSSTMLGTPHYMAPDGETSHASGLYALGCVLYEMLAGVPPFDGETPQKVFVQHMRDEADLGRIPLPARPLVAALLQKEPAFRMDRALPLLEALELPPLRRAPSTDLIAVGDDGGPMPTLVVAVLLGCLGAWGMPFFWVPWAVLVVLAVRRNWLGAGSPSYD
jgi:serine/threonine-protein kinase